MTSISSSDQWKDFCRSFSTRMATYTIFLNFELTSDDISLLIKLITSATNCVQISFGSFIPKDSWNLICEAFKKSRIYGIYLCHESFQDEHGDMLAKALIGNTVSNVDFEGNIGYFSKRKGSTVADGTAIAFAEVLKHPACSISRLSFYRTEVDTPGMVALADAVKVNRSLSFLELHKTVGSGHCFVHSLEHNYRICLQGDPVASTELITFRERNAKYKNQLLHAIQIRDTEAISRYLQLGVDTDGLLQASIESGEDVMRLLLTYPMIKLQVNAGFQPVLHFVCAAGKVREAIVLIERGARLRNTPFDPLFAAIDSKNLQLLTLLGWVGADWNEV